MIVKFFIGGAIVGAAVTWAVYSAAKQSSRWTWGCGG